jgi:CheY-like chemotaxis protein
MDKLQSILLPDEEKSTNYVNQIWLEDLEVRNKLLVANNGLEALQTTESRARETAIRTLCCPTYICP